MRVAAKKSLLEFDAELPNRDELLDANLMKNRLSEILGSEAKNCEIVRAKYKVNSSLRVLYSFDAENDKKYVSARIYAGSQARTNYFVFPNDRKIKNLNILNSPPKWFSACWKSSKVVAYAPEKCVTVACLDDSEKVFAYAKIYTESEFTTGEKVFRFLTEQTAQRLFPKVVGFDEKSKILMLKNIGGNCLANLDKSQSKKAFSLLGKAIAELHEVKTEIGLPKFSRLSPERIRKVVEMISVARQDCKIQAGNLAEKLLKNYSFGDEENVVLHGDVHPKNGILQDDETLTLIDFDQLSYGNPAAEIGSFLAGLFYKKIVGLDSEKERREFSEAFLQGYTEIHDLPSQESLNWHTAAALLTERASRSISRIRIEGLQNFSRILSVSEQVLTGGLK